MSSRSKQIGGSGEFMVIHDLLKEGFDVFRDVTDSCGADLVIVRNCQCTRVQVKTLSTQKNGVVTVKLWKPQAKTWVPYDGTEFDVLALHVLDQGITLYFTLTELMNSGNKSRFSIRMTSSLRSKRSYTDYVSIHRCFNNASVAERL